MEVLDYFVNFMTPEQFTQWLNEMLVFNSSTELNAQQTQMLKDKLGQVFNKVTPSIWIQPSGLGSRNGVMHYC